MDPLFQAFTQPTTVPLESKLQTYLNTFQPPALDDPNNFFLDRPNISNHESSSLTSLLNDAPRKSSVQEANQFITPVLPPNRMTHSLSTPSFSQFPLNSSLLTSQFANLNLDSSNTRLGNQVTNSRCSPQQSPLLNKRSRSPSKRNWHGTNSPSPSHDTYVPPTNMIQESVGGTTYFYSTEQDEGAAAAAETLSIVLPDSYVYPGNPAHIEHLRPKDNAPSFFLPDELRMDILHRHQLVMAEPNPDLYPDLPAEIDGYHKLCPLEPSSGDSPQKSSVFGYITSVYKVVNMKTGIHYCMRRIHNFRVSNTKCMNIIDTWKKIQHSNLVNLREVFTTKGFGDNSLVFVYDFHAGADTLMNQYFNQQQSTLNGYLPNFSAAAGDGFHNNTKSALNSLRQHAGLLPESLIWGYIVQLSSVLRSIHAAGLACRAFEPSKILITGKSRLRLNCCGISDVLSSPDVGQPNSKQMAHFQQEDLLAFGRIVLALACNSLTAIQRQNLQSSLELISRSYSPDLRNLILYLANSSRPRSINDIMPMIGARFYTQLDAAQLRSDVVENELAKEVENGRLFRLITKLGTIVERPEFNMDPSWSETGDRYLLKLFRDYLFHQVSEDGRPWVDTSHIVQCLNKLDIGSTDQICLMSRDEQNVLVVTFAELKACLDSSLNEVMTSAIGSKLNTTS